MGFLRVSTNKNVKVLLEEGITPTPGQIMGGTAQRIEDKLTSVPIVGDAITSARRRAVKDLNRAAYHQALDPIEKNIPNEVGREGVDTVSRQLSDACNKLLPNLKFRADSQFKTEVNAYNASVCWQWREQALGLRAFYRQLQNTHKELP
ncbi:MAG: hypothetical protein ON057_001626 [Glomeribacter sp. 1016415]|nr:hypothetical protein [Glomeribacter sp. 1016415]